MLSYLSDSGAGFEYCYLGCGCGRVDGGCWLVWTRSGYDEWKFGTVEDVGVGVMVVERTSDI